MHRAAAFRSPIAVICIALVLIAAVWVTYRLASATRAGDAVSPPTGGSNGPAVATARVRSGELALTVTAQGRVGAPAGSDAKLTFAVPGIVRSLDVRVGQAVSRGDALAELDRGALGDAVLSARADLAAAQAQAQNGAVGSAAAAVARAKLAVARAHLADLERGGEGALSDRIAAVAAERQSAIKVEADRRSLDRENALFAGGVAARKDVDAASVQLASDLADDRAARAKVAAAGIGFDAALRQARADVAAADSDVAAAAAQAGGTGAQIMAAQAKLAAAEREYDGGVLRAPSDGVVLAILKHPGESVDVTTPALDVGPIESGIVTLSVPAQDAARVAVGNPVELRLAGRFAAARGRVTAVVPNVDPATQAGTVVVAGVPRDAAIGGGVGATIVVGHATGALVPASAIVEDPQSGVTVVFVRGHAKDAPFVERAVRVAVTNGGSAVVASGLHAGEEIATVGAFDLLAPSGG